MEFQHVTNLVRGDEADGLIYDKIKDLAHGEQIAKEIEFLEKEMKVRTINVRINSPGGNLFGGISVYLAIKNSKSIVNTHIEGVAASIAGVIAMAGATRFINDFGRLMIHMPHPPKGVKMDKEMMEGLQHSKEMILKIFQNNTSKSVEELEEIMRVGTWILPDQALRDGFVDRIVGGDRLLTYTLNEIEAIEDESKVWEIVNEMLTKENKPVINKNKQKMDNIKNELNLDESVSNSVVIGKIKDLKNELENVSSAKVLAEEKIVELEIKAEEDAKIMEGLQNKFTEIETAEILEYVENSIKDGKYEEAKKDSLIETATNNFEGFKTLTDSVIVSASIVNQLKGGDSGEDSNGLIDGKLDGKTLRELEKENPAKVEELMNSNKDV